MIESRISAFIFALLLAGNVSSGDVLHQREDADQGPPDALRTPTDSLIEFGEMPLDGRSLLDSWINKRQYTCSRADYSPCANGSRCCPTGGKCCTTGCGRRATDTCCAGGGTCPSGWRCCTLNSCYPIGGECCTGGRYCTPGNRCYRYRGRPVCCTDSACTAYISSGTTITAEGGYNSDYTTTTYVSTTASTYATYRYYYYTITWYYVSYYYTFLQISTTTSTTVTTSTTYSVYASNTFAAERSFSSFSDRITTSTPYDATSLQPLETQSPYQESSSSTLGDVNSTLNETEATVFVTASGSAGGGEQASGGAAAASSTSASAGFDPRKSFLVHFGSLSLFLTLFTVWIASAALMIWL